MARTSNAKKILTAVNVLVIIGLVGATGYFFMENRDLNDQINLTVEEQNRRLVEEINEVFDLPDETPVVARVTDVEEFKATYASFDNAEQGDYLLFFRKSRLNVLYRQDEKRVVKTADVIVPISIELIGSQEAVDDAEEKLAEFGNQITVTKRIDTGITQSFVFDVDADQSDEVISIADQLDIDVGSSLPATITPGDQTEVIIAVATPTSNPAEATTETTDQAE
jgi:hypothetical protein